METANTVILEAKNKRWIIFLFSCFISCILLAEDDPLADIKLKIRSEYPGVQQIGTAELLHQLNDGKNSFQPLLFDVRTHEEFSVSHLHGAHFVPNLDAALKLLHSSGKGQLIVVYCSFGLRSSKLASALIVNGYTNVYNLEGSIFEWANRGNPVYQGDRRVYKVHPFSFWWGRLLNDNLHP